MVPEVESVPLERLVPFHRNPRRGHVGVIRKSLLAHGQYTPLLVNRGSLTGRPAEVLVGNHRLLALRDLHTDPDPRDAEERQLASRAGVRNWSHALVCWTDVDDDEANRIVVVDNRTSDVASNDHAVLLRVLAGLPDLTGTGYVAQDVAQIAAAVAALSTRQSGTADPEDVPEVRADIASRAGDLWVLGPHRLVCGDATDPDDLSLALGDSIPGIVYTDPPYGISIVNRDGKIGHSRGMPFGGKHGTGNVVPTTRYEPVAGDASADVARNAFRLLLAAYPKAKHVWWGANHFASSASVPDASCWLVWDKETGATKFADAELAWTNHPGAVRLLRHRWNGMLRASERGKRVHPTQKPVALALWAFGAIQAPEGVPVLDVFAGSGSTLIAAHQTDRPAVLMEIEPAYCDVICRRWQHMTGIIPRRDGVPHDFV